MDVLKLIRERRTARSFTGEPIDPEVLDRILDAGRMAPSAKNRQAWRFVAVQKSELKAAMADASYGDRRVLDAGCVVAICTTNIHYTMPNGQSSYPMDLSFATAFMMMQAESEGLSSALLGTYDERSIKDILTVPHAMRVALLLAIGAKGEEEPTRLERHPMDRVVSFDHW
ncbi:MAG: nitroreductase family protein [Spirochaetales bacterium]|nr:nitroreductase family protein [Spirochaetales bacterium]